MNLHESFQQVEKAVRNNTGSEEDLQSIMDAAHELAHEARKLKLDEIEKRDSKIFGLNFYEYSRRFD